jgi:hypothetical protein
MAGSEVLPKIMNGFADSAERNLVMPSNSVQYVRFYQVYERQPGTRGIGQFNDGPENFGPPPVGYFRPATHDRSVAGGIDK